MACSSSSRDLEIGLLQVWGWCGRREPLRSKQCSYLHLQTILECPSGYKWKSRLGGIQMFTPFFKKNNNFLKVCWRRDWRDCRREASDTNNTFFFLMNDSTCCHVARCVFHLTHLDRTKYWILRRPLCLTLDEQVPCLWLWLLHCLCGVLLNNAARRRRVSQNDSLHE